MQDDGRKDYAIGYSSPFHKSVLIPFWVIRIVVLGTNVILPGRFVTQEDSVTRASVGIPISISLPALNVVTIIKRATRTLGTLLFLATDVV